jgi:hypothetical protein
MDAVGAAAAKFSGSIELLRKPERAEIRHSPSRSLAAFPVPAANQQPIG